MKKNKELADTKRKVLSILRDNNVFTYLSLIIKQGKLNNIYCHSIKNRETKVVTESKFKNYSYTISTNLNNNDSHFKISLAETHRNSYSYRIV